APLDRRFRGRLRSFGPPYDPARRARWQSKLRPEEADPKVGRCRIARTSVAPCPTTSPPTVDTSEPGSDDVPLPESRGAETRRPALSLVAGSPQTSGHRCWYQRSVLRSGVKVLHSWRVGPSYTTSIRQAPRSRTTYAVPRTTRPVLREKRSAPTRSSAGGRTGRSCSSSRSAGPSR